MMTSQELNTMVNPLKIKNNVLVLWYNFSSSTDYDSNICNSDFSLYRAKIDINNIISDYQKCHCGLINFKKLNTIDSVLYSTEFSNIKYKKNNASINYIDVYSFYDVFKNIITSYFNTFIINSNTILIHDEYLNFDKDKICDELIKKLKNTFHFTNGVRTEQMCQFPYINLLDSSIIEQMKTWLLHE